MKKKQAILITFCLSMGFTATATEANSIGAKYSVDKHEKTLDTLAFYSERQKRRDLRRWRILMWEMRVEIKYKRRREKQLQAMSRSNTKHWHYLREQIDVHSKNIRALQLELEHVRSLLK